MKKSRWAMCKLCWCLLLKALTHGPLVLVFPSKSGSTKNVILHLQWDWNIRGVGCVLEQPRYVVPGSSIPAATSGKDSESPRAPWPPALSLAIPRAPDRSKAYLLPGFASIVAEQTRMDSSPGKPIIQERRVWKRERETFILGTGAGAGDGLQA